MILITVCANPTGIGFPSARLLASHGHHVWATVRDMTKVPTLSDGLEPGPVATNLSRLYEGRLTTDGKAYEGWFERGYAWVQQKAPKLESAEEVCQMLVQIGEDQHPALRIQSSKPARAYLPERWTDLTGNKDRDAFIAFFKSLER